MAKSKKKLFMKVRKLQCDDQYSIHRNQNEIKSWVEKSKYKQIPKNKANPVQHFVFINL